MSSISPLYQPRTFTPAVPSFAPEPAHNRAPDTVFRATRSLEPTSRPGWTLDSLPAPSAEASSAADRALQAELGQHALRRAADRPVALSANTTIFPLFDAYRSAFDTPELRAWFLNKGMALSTVVVKPDSVSGSVTYDGVTSVRTFTTYDDSDWWQASARLRAAAKELDPDGMGLPYAGTDSDTFSRNAVLRWYGVEPPTSAGDAKQAQHALSTADFSAPSAAQKAERARRVQTARNAIGNLDERAHLAKIMTQYIAGLPDDRTVSLGKLDVHVSSTSALPRNAAGLVPISEVLKSYGRTVPTTAGEMRNAVRWLSTSLPPPPPLGNYSQLFARTWAPGKLSDADKAYLAEVNTDDKGAPGQFSLLRTLDAGGILDQNTLEELRDQADDYLSLLLSDPTALLKGDRLAFNRHFIGASGTRNLSDEERKQWMIAAVKLQIDPDADGRPGMIAGYDLYQPGNSGRNMPEVRAELETHLQQNKGLDPKAATLIAHLFLPKVAPEFLVRGVSDELLLGSPEWADLRLGVTFAERQGGAGSSRVMNYQEIMALSRLDATNLGEASLLSNYAMDVLLDWGVMQGLYVKPTDGQFTKEQYQQALDAFNTQREQLLQALKAFNLELPSREDLAIRRLLTVFPGFSAEQLKSLRVEAAYEKDRRNSLPSERSIHPLVEAYMAGDLKKDYWMLLAPGEHVPLPPPKTSAYSVPVLSAADQARVDKTVQAFNQIIDKLPDVRAQLPDEVDSYLNELKQGLSTTTRRMIANLPLADRQALELGNVELFALREHIKGVPIEEQSSEQVEERRGRKGTLIRSEYKGEIRYFEVFPDKLLIVKRDDLKAELKLGGTLQDFPKTYGRWAPSILNVQDGAVEPFDFTAYSSDAAPRPGVTSPGIIVEKLGKTLVAPAETAQNSTASFVPSSFSSARTHSIVDRIMQGNFIHHRDSVLKLAHGELPIERKREISRTNDRILLGMIPFVGAVVDLANGNIVEGTRGLIIDLTGAFVGGAGSAVGAFVKTTKVVAPFGAKALRVLEKGVTVVSAFLNPLDGTADLLTGAARGISTIPKLLTKAPRPMALTTLGSVEEKVRVFLGVRIGLDKLAAAQGADAHNGYNHAVPVNAVHLGAHWYAADPASGLPIGTPLDGFKPLSTQAA